jgi:spore maturation protein CgeB
LSSLGRILYVGDLSEGTTTLDRFRALGKIGCSLASFNSAPYLRGGNRLFRSIGWRFCSGPNVSRFNQDLQRFVIDHAPVDTIWIDKGVWVWSSTLAFLKKRFGARALHLTPDPAILFHKSRHFLNSLPLYDAVFTFKKYEVGLYRDHGASNVHLLRMSYEPSRFFPRTPVEEFACDVIFIGHKEQHYLQHLEAIAKLGIDLRIWGPGWGRGRGSSQWERTYVKGNGLWGEAYPVALSSAKIAIGLLTKLAPDTVTTRSLEIPACGTFMLAEDSDDHQSLFKSGQEAAFFTTPQDLASKVTRYLQDDAERGRIAAAGHKKCLSPDLSNEGRMREVLALAGA